MLELDADTNLVICQKSKVNDWIEHFQTHYIDFEIFDGTKKQGLQQFFDCGQGEKRVLIINYELAFRRPELKQLEHFTLMLDESSMIQNEQAKRSKFILSLKYENVILLSGTPTAGKYEKLWSQCRLLGWNISKDLYWKQYINFEIFDNEGYPIKIVRGYKNIERLKAKLREHGAIFMKSDEVFDLPTQSFIDVAVNTTKDYRKFRKDSLLITDKLELVGDTTLTKMLYERMLCGQYNSEKISAFKDIVNSTEDRLIVFYNFTEELAAMMQAIDRDISIVNGSKKDLSAYENVQNSVTFVQYQAGAMGLNLQKANKIIYFTPPLSSELFEQSKKRIHRIGQEKPCFYYSLICRNSIEQKIKSTLAMRKDFTDRLFENS